jgi:lipoprotein-anchoring transpeptidase ErfK/SrfK
MNIAFLPMMKNVLPMVLSVSTLWTLTSCATFEDRPPPRAELVLYEWHDDDGPGDVSMEINLTTQRAIVKRGGRMIGWCFVATGKEGKGTPAGSYRVTEKIVDKYSNKYGWIEDEMGNVTNNDAKPSSPRKPGEKYFPAPMPYWQRLTSYGIGMHIGTIPEPGKPASHGCIRMPKEFAPRLYEVTKVGTPVRIVYGPNQEVIAWQ